MKVKIKKLHPDAIIPKYAKDGDAGLDLTSIGREVYIDPISGLDCKFTHSTGLAIEIPKGYVGLIFPRSSIHRKKDRLTNSVGVIDSGYRGEIKFVFDGMCYKDQYYPGDRIGQLIIIPYPSIEFEEVAELSSTERGETGFGSSGV